MSAKKPGKQGKAIAVAWQEVGGTLAWMVIGDSLSEEMPKAET